MIAASRHIERICPPAAGGLHHHHLAEVLASVRLFDEKIDKRPQKIPRTEL